MSEAFLQTLDRCAETGRPARLWLRDDDAVAPSGALDRLLRLTNAAEIPVTLAVIPAHSGQALADRLRYERRVTVAVHGWSHQNHARAGEKKQELGAHRPVATVLGELQRGFAALSAWHGPRFQPVLVPPWNRIAPEVVAGLPDLGFRAVSVFGVEKPAPLQLVNTHIDPIDWHGTGGGRPLPELMDALALAVAQGGPVGVLTHHLVHDAAVWAFLAKIIAMTRAHPGCRWVALPNLMRES